MGLWPNHIQRSDTLRGLPDTFGSGACVLDINNDLWPDLLVLGGEGSTRHFGKPNWWALKGRNQLYLNRHGIYFEDISESAGINEIVNGQGCTAGDLDNDGFADVLITTTGKDLLYRNNGNLTFTLVAKTPMNELDEWTSGALFVDINQDNLLDVFVGGFIQYQQDRRVFESETGFEGAVKPSFLPERFDAIASRLYLNKGDFKFEDITESAGILNRSGRTLGVYWHDINEDLLPDLVELNAYVSDSKVWINQGKAKFRADPTYQGLLENNAALSFAVTDLDGNDQTDLVLGSQAGRPVIIRRDLSEEHSWRDLELALSSIASTSWGVSVKDLDNDGHRDLFLANGLLVPHGDSQAASQGQPNALFLSDGNPERKSIPENADIALQKSSRTVLSADFNNDGALDLYVTSNNSMGQLFLNSPQRNDWLQVIARDNLQHRRPYRVALHTETGVQTSYESESVAHLGQNEGRFHFGLRPGLRLLRLEVTWQDGTNNVFSDLQSDSLYLVSPKGEMCRARTTLSASTASCVQDFGIVPSNPSRKPETKPLPAAMLHLKRKILAYQPQKAADDDRVDAKQMLAAKESDESVYWLMYRLTSQLSACPAADFLSHLFDEEEAALQAKYQSVPSLLLALDSKRGENRKCVVEALGHSERFRANAPLLELLSGVDPEVQRVIVIALGRLRQTDSLPALQKLILTGPPELAADAVLSAEQIEKGTGMKLWRKRHDQASAITRVELDKNLQQAQQSRPLMHTNKNASGG